jgi:uncharacterized protein
MPCSIIGDIVPKSLHRFVNQTALLFIPLICFIGGFFSTLAGLGGGLFTLASTSLLLPVNVVIPLNGVLILAGQITRVAQFHGHINWDITRPFIPGSVIGAAIGTYVYFGLPEVLTAFLLGSVLLWLCWFPPTITARNIATRIPFPFFWIGIVHTFLSAVTGAGVLFQSVIVNSTLPKERIVATIAATLLFMAVFKSAGYLLAGFDYSPFLAMILASWLMGICGTMLGKHCLNLLPDSYFRLLIKVVITFFAFRLFWSAGEHF